MNKQLIKLITGVLLPIVVTSLVTLRDPEDILRRKTSFGIATFLWQSFAFAHPCSLRAVSFSERGDRGNAVENAIEQPSLFSRVTDFVDRHIVIPLLRNSIVLIWSFFYRYYVRKHI